MNGDMANARLFELGGRRERDRDREMNARLRDILNQQRRNLEDLGRLNGMGRPMPTKKVKKTNIPWKDYDHTFRVGDRFLVKNISISEEDTVNKLHDVSVIETCNYAIKTVEYGWISRDRKVEIVEFLDIYKSSLIERSNGKS